MDYWVDVNGQNAIWWYESSGFSYWIIEDIQYLGTLTAAIASISNTLEKKCPNNDVWNWMYGDLATNSFVATNYVYLKCANDDDFCTSENPCGVDQGDCDVHDDCQDGLVCGSSNCPNYLGYSPNFDCCHCKLSNTLLCLKCNASVALHSILHCGGHFIP